MEKEIKGRQREHIYESRFQIAVAVADAANAIAGIAATVTRTVAIAV